MREAKSRPSPHPSLGARQPFLEPPLLGPVALGDRIGEGERERVPVVRCTSHKCHIAALGVSCGPTSSLGLRRSSGRAGRGAAGREWA